MLTGAAVFIASSLFASAAQKTGATAPENLALRAVASADSEYSKDYLAKFAIDGKIPEALGKKDTGQAWVVNGKTSNNAADFSLEWLGPVRIAEVVYYARTGWMLNEGWREAAVHVDGSAAAVCKTALQCGHGPQRIRLPSPVAATKLTLKFRGSYGGTNLGASEIQVYSASPPDAMLGKFVAADGAAAPAAQGRRVGGRAPAPPPVAESPQLAADLKAGKLGFTRVLVVQRNHVGCSHVYTYHVEGQRDGGGLFSLNPADGALTKLLDSPDGQILSYDLSFDARELLVSWRKGRHYQIYRMDLDPNGQRVSNVHQITHGDCHNFDPVWLPDGDIAFLSTRTPLVAYCWTTDCGVLHRMKPDGSDVRRISWNYLNDFTPSLLNDGRLLYGRWEYVDRPAIPIQGLWAINPDGTGMAGFYGNRVLGPATFIEARAVPGSHKVLCTMTGHNGTLRGAIGLIDIGLGDNAQESMTNVTPEVGIGSVDRSSNGPRGPYQTPYPVDGTYFLVSHDGTILLRDYDVTKQVTVLRPEGLGFYNPQPLRPRPRPPVRASTLPATAGPWATIVLQDVYVGLEPVIPRGTVKRLCVVQEIAKPLVGRSTGFGFQRPVVSCGATYTPKKVWGFVNVAPDGSATFRVPANEPIYFLPLDERGRAVQRMRTFTHLMPGEVQGCVGCHSERSLLPPTAAALAAASAASPQELTPPDWGVRGFDYCSVVQPVLDKHCIRCHNAREHPNGIDLTGDRTMWFNVSYDALAYEKSRFSGLDGESWRSGSPYVSWISTMNGTESNILHIEPLTWGSPRSKLADLVLAGHADKNGKPRVSLSSDERQRILTWIDVNAPYYGTSTTTHQELRGGRALEARALGTVLKEVAARRCAECHKGMPPVGRVRFTGVENNAFLAAPLAKSAGGWARCGRAVFADTGDGDYQKLLKVFEPITEMLKANPRQDMPGAAGCDGKAACPK